MRLAKKRQGRVLNETSSRTRVDLFVSKVLCSYKVTAICKFALLMYMSEFCCYVFVELLTAITSDLPMKPGRTRNTRLAESKLKPPFIMSRSTKVISTC